MVKYQGPVPEGASVNRFRKTGLTQVKEKGKYVLYKDSQANKKKSKSKLIDKLLTQKIKSRQISKANKATVKIKEYNAPSILNDENRFFNSEMKQTKKEMFFS